MNWGVHWFRRDLRVTGNRALYENWKKTGGNTLGIFCFDSKFLAREDFSANRFAFFLDTLGELRTELRKQGGDLLVIDAQPAEAFQTLFQFLENTPFGKPNIVSYGLDYEPFARHRDAEICKILHESKIEEIARRDHLLVEPHEIRKDDGGFYQVYSPFAKRWFQALASDEVQDRIHSQRSAQKFKMTWSELGALPKFPFKDAFDAFQQGNQKMVSVTIPKAGFAEAYTQLKNFKKKLTKYDQDRDFPAVGGNSRLSIFLKNGSLTSSQILSELDLSKVGLADKSAPVQFIKELAWREFYYSILYHRPNVEKESFLPQYRNLKWENNETWFEHWKEGATGFPIVDAGMRELKTTGFMHNRVRMIVASFLTKDLLIDWKWGEQYFMKMLLDGDLAANNGGWQWAASTGCDPQPYFRIFNPWLQGEKFDRDGIYIKRFVPELAKVPSKLLHKPDADRSSSGYPVPIVDHALQRGRALGLYRVK